MNDGCYYLYNPSVFAPFSSTSTSVTDIDFDFDFDGKINYCKQDCYLNCLRVVTVVCVLEEVCFQKLNLLW